VFLGVCFSKQIAGTSRDESTAAHPPSLTTFLSRVENLVKTPAPRSTERMIPEAKRVQIITALKANPNGLAVAKQVGGISAPTVYALAKKANIALSLGGPKKFSAEKQAQIIKALKANPNASEVARQIGGISSRTVARFAKKANIELTAGKAAAKEGYKAWVSARHTAAQ
jgi:hypothetical protein